MNKAIAILKMMATNENLTGVYHNEANQALAELAAHKAKVEELKRICNINIEAYTNKEGVKHNMATPYENILQKLEELDK